MFSATSSACFNVEEISPFLGEVFCVNNFDNLYAGGFRQYTMGRIEWVDVWVLMRPFMVGAEGFMSKYIL